MQTWSSLWCCKTEAFEEQADPSSASLAPEHTEDTFTLIRPEEKKNTMSSFTTSNKHVMTIAFNVIRVGLKQASSDQLVYMTITTFT